MTNYHQRREVFENAVYRLLSPFASEADSQALTISVPMAFDLCCDAAFKPEDAVALMVGLIRNRALTTPTTTCIEVIDLAGQFNWGRRKRRSR